MELSKLHKIFRESTGVTTDSRNIKTNNIFFALKGENFNGNKFAESALQQGAKLVVIDEAQYHTDKDKMVLVDDTLQTLQDLAKLHRAYIGLPIIALTGSNGKTTTKELIHAVLQKKYNTQATFGNLNNHIGVPLTLLSLREDTDIGIIEMGANHQKEIELLCDIAQPDFGYITNFGRAHLEGFGGFEGVIKGKSELYDYLLNHKKTVFINQDDELQVKKSSSIRQFGFSSTNESAKVFFNKVEAQPMAAVSVKDTHIQSQLTGIYNTVNICAAVSIGIFFGIDLSDIKHAIENYMPNNNRSQWVNSSSNKVLLDAYNANPSSMKAALTNFFQLHDNYKLLILGDMFELGQESDKEHQIIIDLVAEQNITTYFVGKEFYKHHHRENDSMKFFESFEQLKDFLHNQSIANQTILVKGSRGMQLERALDLLT